MGQNFNMLTAVAVVALWAVTAHADEAVQFTQHASDN